MNYFLIILIILFYIFFFLRAFFLSKTIGKNIKAKNLLLNTSLILAGISSIIFLIHLIFPSIGIYLFIIYYSDLLSIIGTILITAGLIISSVASLSLGKSWRIGVNENKKTKLITNGIYKISRNPYFLSYDFVLIGMVFYLISPVLIIPVLITIILFHLMILKEEKYLESKHQDSYRKYKKEVRRYI